ncbi:MAG TPA: endopeptidase La, partial [Gammaproteobacteria bacterium]|nr:endopeptidase La [Gammaproteobacteria bacterium]
VEGSQRARITNLMDDGPYLRAELEAQVEQPVEGREADAILKTVLTQFEQYAQSNKKVPQEVLSSLSGIDDPSRMIDTIAAQMTL